MLQPSRCPLCTGEIARGELVCRRCGYRPDSYNRAQDDVALSFRLAISDRSRTKTSSTSTPGATWLSAIPAWCKSHWPPAR